MQVEGFKKLVQLAQANDKASREQLVVLVDPFVKRWCRSFAKPLVAHLSVRDLPQEGWGRIFEMLHQFRGGTTDDDAWRSFLKWAKLAVRGRILKEIEKLQAQKRNPRRPIRRISDASPSTSSGLVSGVNPPDCGPSPSTAAGKIEDAKRLREALDSLPHATDREVIERRTFESQTLAEIAERLGMTESQTREHYRRGMRLLKTMLGDSP